MAVLPAAFMPPSRRSHLVSRRQHPRPPSGSTSATYRLSRDRADSHTIPTSTRLTGRREPDRGELGEGGRLGPLPDSLGGNAESGSDDGCEHVAALICGSTEGSFEGPQRVHGGGSDECKLFPIAMTIFPTETISPPPPLRIGTSYWNLQPTFRYDHHRAKGLIAGCITPKSPFVLDTQTRYIHKGDIVVSNLLLVCYML